jgi:hypothetical protein
MSTSCSKWCVSQGLQHSIGQRSGTASTAGKGQYQEDITATLGFQAGDGVFAIEALEWRIIRIACQAGATTKLQEY